MMYRLTFCSATDTASTRLPNNRYRFEKGCLAMHRASSTFVSETGVHKSKKVSYWLTCNLTCKMVSFMDNLLPVIWVCSTIALFCLLIFDHLVGNISQWFEKLCKLLRSWNRTFRWTCWWGRSVWQSNFSECDFGIHKGEVLGFESMIYSLFEVILNLVTGSKMKAVRKVNSDCIYALELYHNSVCSQGIASQLDELMLVP